STPAVDAARWAGASLSAEEVAALDAAREFAMHRHGLQAAQMERLADELPLPQIQLPMVTTPCIGPAEIEHLAAALADGVGHLHEEEQWQ
ncbi:MAG: hypothetical protein ACRDVW_05350, partial [Acidimicrobiales bacterium]